MACKSDVIRLLGQGMTAPQVAAKLQCTDGYVRATAYRNNIDFPRSHRSPLPAKEWVVDFWARLSDERRAELARFMGARK